MSKKYNKILAGLAAAAAVGAGVFYFLKKKEAEKLDDEFEDEGFEDDFELDEDLEEVPAQREYVSLTPSTDEASTETQICTEEDVVSEEAAAEEVCACEENCCCEDTKEACCCEEAPIEEKTEE